MGHATKLSELYAAELMDLWSANDQMHATVAAMADLAEDMRLAEGFKRSASGVGRHVHTLSDLLLDVGQPAVKERCKGMAGLVAEARMYMTLEAPARGDLLDLVMIAQYQRMSHYGLAGFETAAAYAKALGHDNHACRLKQIVAEICSTDKYATEFAERAEQIAAVGDAASA